ncbi:hypothetical protein, partial [Solemya velum gill symbiont]|uniref:hypothetical protein n=1 Tax=Solemya velum gill symbiont TaxID=2340 RepID=UPI001E5E695F
LDDLFRFVSLDSHFWSSVFLIIRVDQLIGGGSGRRCSSEKRLDHFCAGKASHKRTTGDAL